MSLSDVLRLLEQLPDTAQVPVGWVRAQLQAADTTSTSAAPDPAPKEGGDRWISAREVATRLNCSRRYVYQHARTFPFARKLPSGTVRFSERGLEKWMKLAASRDEGRVQT